MVHPLSIKIIFSIHHGFNRLRFKSVDTVDLDITYALVYILKATKDIRIHTPGTMNNHAKLYGNLDFLLRGVVQLILPALRPATKNTIQVANS